jgi:hypothetical protein
LRVRTRQENLRAALFFTDVVDVSRARGRRCGRCSRGSDFVAAQQALRRTALNIDGDVAVLDALDDAVDDFADAVLEFVVLASRSASRTFCMMTCFAVWAAMRPKSSGGSRRS